MNKNYKGKKISLFVCMLVISMSFIGCASSEKDEVVPDVGNVTTVQPTNAVEPVADNKPKADYITTDKITIKPQTTAKTNDVTGSIVNNNPMDLTVYLVIVYFNKDKSILYTENIRVDNAVAGQKVYYNDTVIGTDVSKCNNYTVQVDSMIEK